MAKYILIITLLISSHNIAQTSSDTNIPKKFLTEDTKGFDLVGKVKNVTWISIDSITTGNTYSGEYYKGTIDTISLEFNKKIKLKNSKRNQFSIKTYNKNFEYKNENITLESFNNLDYSDIPGNNYRKLIDEEGNLSNTYLIFDTFYNNNGDIKEMSYDTEDKEQTTKIIYKYKYDEIGNWIIKTSIAIDGYGKSRTNKTSYRTIEYWK